jgi:hypothetical protein
MQGARGCIADLFYLGLQLKLKKIQRNGATGVGSDARDDFRSRQSHSKIQMDVKPSNINDCQPCILRALTRRYG